MTDAERIAARLSPAQRRAVMWLPADGSVRVAAEKTAPRRVSFVGETRIGDPNRKIARVYRLSLIEYGHAFSVDPTKRHDRINLTPLGQAVRAVLEREARDG